MSLFITLVVWWLCFELAGVSYLLWLRMVVWWKKRLNAKLRSKQAILRKGQNED